MLLQGREAAAFLHNLGKLGPKSEQLAALALQQGHQITKCGHCGGPRVHSKKTNAAKCVRCWLGDVATAQRSTWRRCEACREAMTGLSRQARFCKDCQKLGRKEKKWARERAMKKVGELAEGVTLPSAASPD